VKMKAIKIKSILILVFSLSILSRAYAIDFYLRAGITNVTMPDGKVIPMWGFAKDSSFGAHDGTLMVPGPALRIPSGDSTLKIHLENTLPEPISIVIPGLVPKTSPSPTRLTDGRASSISTETPSGNTTPTLYEWENVRAGTHLYLSGSNPAKQVQMGLYGAVIKDYSSGEAYQGVNYDSELVVFFSEIDPIIHNAVSSDEYGSGKRVPSSVDYDAKYFLINGGSFPQANTFLDAGDSPTRILLRFLNAGLDSHVPIIQGGYFEVVSEDGWKLPYPQRRYSFVLPAGKTIDAVLVGLPQGKYPIYDRRLDLSNDRSRGGGMLSYLGIGLRLLTIQKSGTGVGTIKSNPEGIDCGLKCAELFEPGSQVTLSATPRADSVFVSWSEPSCVGLFCTITLTTDKTINAIFQGKFSISGNLRTPEGSPLSGATISLGGEITNSTTTDSEGNYSFTGLRNGDYTITPSLSGYNFTPNERRISIGGASVSGQNFIGNRIIGPEFVISGRVMNGTTGVPGVTMTLSGDASGTTTTGVFGEYKFPNLLSGNYTVSPSKAGYVFSPPSRALVVAGTDKPNIDFLVSSAEQRYSISGSIITPGGAPVSGVNIEVVGVINTTTDGGGSYIVGGLQNGTYTVVPSKAGYSFTPSSLTPTINNSPASGIDFVAYQIAPAIIRGAGSQDYTVSGRVRDRDGNPIEGVRIYLSGELTKEAVTDSKGYYRISGLSDGTYTIKAQKQGYVFEPQEIEFRVKGSNVRGRSFRAR